MTINEFLQKYRRVENGMNVTRPRVKCADGFTVSVQAGCGCYSAPYGDADRYTMVELGYPSSVDDIILPYGENVETPRESSVFGHVPVEVVDQLLEAHGGIVGADFSNDRAGKWREHAVSNLTTIKKAALQMLHPLRTRLEAQGYQLVYACIVGSHAYGTATPDSDIDVRGVVTRSPKDILIGKDAESFTDPDNDVTLYTFDKFVKMLASGNPNIVDMVGVKPEFILCQTDVSHMVFDNIHLFMSKRIGTAYRGFAQSSLHRILKLQRYMVDDKKVHKAMMHHIRTLSAGAMMLATGEPCACATNVDVLRALRAGCGLDEYGALTDAFINMSHGAYEALDAALQSTSLPEIADTAGIEDLLARVNATVLGVNYKED